MGEISPNPIIHRILSNIPKTTLDPGSALSGRWAVQSLISEYLVTMDEHADKIFQDIWQDLYIKMTQQLIELQSGISEYLYHRVTHQVMHRPDLNAYELRLVADVFIAQTREITQYIPKQMKWKLDPITNREIPVEWMCGHCDVPNPMINRTCDHCGAPRALLIQELLSRK